MSHDQTKGAILVFRTAPDSKNTNNQLPQSIYRALKQQNPDCPVHFCAVHQCVQLIDELKPRYVIGLGSIAFDSVDFAAIGRAAKRADGILAYWLFDDPYEFDFSWKLSCHCDWIFSNDKATVDFYQSRQCSHLPLAADRHLHFRECVDPAGKSVDIFFCGFAYQNRLDIIDAVSTILRRHKTVIKGAGWKEELPFCANERVSADDLPDLYANAKATLYIGRDLNIANRRYEIVPSTPGPRLFEAAAAGTPQLYFLDTMEIFDYYEKDREIITFSSISEFDERVASLLSDEGHARDVAQCARERTARNHTYENRVDAIMTVLERVERER